MQILCKGWPKSLLDRIHLMIQLYFMHFIHCCWVYFGMLRRLVGLILELRWGDSRLGVVGFCYQLYRKLDGVDLYTQVSWVFLESTIY